MKTTWKSVPTVFFAPITFYIKFTRIKILTSMLLTGLVQGDFLDFVCLNIVVLFTFKLT